jgi:antitoxin (DNA-binding transcriptional repressor) of toxin-antitoxin stability system
LWVTTDARDVVEAVREFSKLLYNIKYRGERYAIVRRGKPVAMLCPAESARSAASLAELREIASALPRLDGDDMNFLNTEGVQLEVR